jgi:hypothetical protein
MPTIDHKPPPRTGQPTATTNVDANVNVNITAPVTETPREVVTPELRSGADPLANKLNELGAKDQSTVRSTFSRLLSLFGGASQLPTTTTQLPTTTTQLPHDVDGSVSQLPTPASLPPLREVRAEVRAEARAADVVKKPTIDVLYKDAQFAKLYDFVMTSVHKVERNHTEWDKLGQVRNFATAVDFVMKGKALDGTGSVDATGNLFARFPGTQERRAICHLLLLLMPPSDRTERPMMPNGSRAAPQDLFRPFPASVIAKANDDFPIRAGDLPKINPIFTQHLTSPTFLDDVFKPGQRGLFLASKKFCPGAFVQDRKDINPPTLDKKQQSGHEGDPIMVRIDDIVDVNGVKHAKVHVPAQHKVWLGDNGGTHVGQEVLGKIDTVTDLQGKSTGEPILIPVDHLAKYMLAEGDGSRGLDLTRPEDRAIALTYAETLKTTHFTDKNGITKSLFDWLEQADHRTPKKDVTSIRHMAREAAFQAVARYSSHPRRTHFRLDVDPLELAAVKSGKKPLEQSDWQVQAFVRLEETGICRDCGNHYEKDKASTQHVHEMAWTAQFLSSGYVGGSLDCLGSSDAFDKLSKTFLEPIGVLSTTGIAEGHGAALSRVLGQPDDNGVIQAGVPMKVKLNELIVGLEMPLSSGRGPAAQYMENWGGYLRIDGIRGQSVDFVKANAKLDATMAGLQP